MSRSVHALLMGSNQPAKLAQHATALSSSTLLIHRGEQSEALTLQTGGDMKKEIEGDVVVDLKKEPPTFIYMRWSKVLSKFVPCDATDRDAVMYKLYKEG